MKTILFFLSCLAGVSVTVVAQSAVQVEVSGSGKPVLYLPGFATPGAVWNETISQLPDHRALVVTYAGFGGLDPVETPWYEKVKGEIEAYIRTNELQKLTLVGHSMGGNLALDLAAALADHVEKIIIVDALACMREVMMPGVPADALGYDSPYNDQLLAMDEAAQSTYLDQMTQGMISRPEDQRKVKAWMQEADRKTFVYGYVDLLKLDSRPLLPSIEVPVLIIVAGQPFGPQALELMKGQYENLAQKTFAFAEASKHYVMLDQPDWLVNEFRSFLSK